jgi:hypothetical protein
LTEPIVVEGSGDLLMYPNPFSWPETAAHFLVPVPRHVRLTLENPAGVVVRTLVDQHISEGFHDLWWDGLDDDGQPVPAGEYWAVLEIAGDVAADLAFLDAPVPVPEDPRFVWTISGSATDPFANTTADHSGSGIMSLYLWLACNTPNGFSQAQFDVDGTYEVLATNYRNGFTSAGGATSLLLHFSCLGEPLVGPILAAEFLVLEGTGTGNLCLAPSSLTGRNASLDCFDPEWVPNTYLGFSDDGNPPCLETGGTEELCP